MFYVCFDGLRRRHVDINYYNRNPSLVEGLLDIKRDFMKSANEGTQRGNIEIAFSERTTSEPGTLNY